MVVKWPTGTVRAKSEVEGKMEALKGYDNNFTLHTKKVEEVPSWTSTPTYSPLFGSSSLVPIFSRGAT